MSDALESEFRCPIDAPCCEHKLFFYNSKSRQKEVFSPLNEDAIRLYVCGPTVYDDIHIGNARSFIVYDLLFRLLRYHYGADKVHYVRNITDIDDKINQRAALSYSDIDIRAAIKRLSDGTIEQFHQDMRFLNCLAPTKEPRASLYVEQIKELIERLVGLGCAYIAQDHILFSPNSMDKLRYGALSQKPLDQLRAGARIEVAPYKRDSLDFVLWKPSLKGEPAWPSPCSIAVKGRPGWHIECSAMSIAELIEPFGGGWKAGDLKDNDQRNSFDIHGGGVDLIFPHHENEVAQSCCALRADSIANYWLHNGFLLVDGHKMSKSLGNFITVKQLLEQGDVLDFAKGADIEVKKYWLGLAIRLAMLKTHYRQPLNWTVERLKLASNELYRWYRLLWDGPEEPASAQKDVDKELALAWLAPLYDDLNTPLAISFLQQAYHKRQLAILRGGLQMLGLWPQDAILTLLRESFARSSIFDKDAIEEKIQQRLFFLEAQNWSQADAIRDELRKAGIQLCDNKDPITKKRVTQWSYL